VSSNPYIFNPVSSTGVNPASTTTGIVTSSVSTPALGLAQTGVSNISQNGFIGGVQIGYNYQWQQNYILGAEADFQGSTIKGNGVLSGGGYNSASMSSSYNQPAFGETQAVTSSTITNISGSTVGNTAISTGINWLGTVRGRIGYLFLPTLQVYGTAGLAYGNAYANVSQWAATSNSSSVSTNGVPANAGSGVGTQMAFGSGRSNSTLVGWSAGGGVEWMFMPNWSAKFEGLYYNLGSSNVQTYSLGSAAQSLTVTGGNVAYPAVLAVGRTQVTYNGAIARAGVNYHFNWSNTPNLTSY